MESHLPMHRSCAVLMLVLLCVGAVASDGAPRDVVALFRDEIVDATAQIKWRGPRLSDETLLAVAASGIGWRPKAGGVDLVREEKKTLRYAPPEARLRGYVAAVGARDERTAFAFALSLVLEPPPSMSGWSDAFTRLAAYVDGFDRVLIGILQAPEHFPLLSQYEYAAADVLVYRGSVRLLPLFLTLVDSRDEYLRSRAVAGIGVAACRRDYAAPPPGLLFAPHAQTLSAGQRRMVDDALVRAAADRSARVRAAAALALGLAGGDDQIPLLERLMKDPACVRTNAGRKDRAELAFPVRAQAAEALAGLGRAQAPVGGVYEGPELKRALRGTVDVTREMAHRRGAKISAVRFHTGDW